jgi:hypothetical protein
MKNTYFILFLALLTISCSKDDDSQEPATPTSFELSVKQDPLKSMWEEILSLSESETCNDPAEWEFAAYGSKPCGGPWGYIAYSVNIDTADFQAKLEEFRIEQKKYNEDNGQMSTCDMAEEPSGVTCESGKAVLVY